MTAVRHADALALLNTLGDRPTIVIPHESLVAGFLLSLLFFAAVHESAAMHSFCVRQRRFAVVLIGAHRSSPKSRVAAVHGSEFEYADSYVRTNTLS
jgi:hypothetical protein